jgi:hypothetical protein
MSNSILPGNWKQHPVYTDYYFSEDGRAMSKKKGKYRELTGTTCGQQGYKAIAVGGSKKIYIHRSVCELFHGPQPAGQQCRHLDGNRYNNSAANLQWGSPKENAYDKVGHGTVATKEKNPMAKLKSEQVQVMREIRATTGLSFKKISKQFSVSTMTAFRAITQRSWK